MSHFIFISKSQNLICFQNFYLFFFFFFLPPEKSNSIESPWNLSSTSWWFQNFFLSKTVTSTLIKGRISLKQNLNPLFLMHVEILPSGLAPLWLWPRAERQDTAQESSFSHLCGTRDSHICGMFLLGHFIAPYTSVLGSCWTIIFSCSSANLEEVWYTVAEIIFSQLGKRTLFLKRGISVWPTMCPRGYRLGEIDLLLWLTAAEIWLEREDDFLFPRISEMPERASAQGL